MGEYENTGQEKSGLNMFIQEKDGRTRIANIGSNREWRHWKQYQKKSHCWAVEAAVEARATEKGPRPAPRQPAGGFVPTQLAHCIL